MKRLKNWPSRFAALVASARLQPFEWGSHDCCLWAASAVLALTGVDPAAGLRGSYRTEAAAMALVAQLGGLPAVAARAGAEISPAHAAQGDIGLVTWPDGIVSLGVCSGPAWLCAGATDLVSLPRDAASRAWGVGRE